MSIKRRTWSPRARRNLFLAHGGKCCVCGLPITFKNWIVEHRVPLSMSGADDLSNIAPAHAHCAREKTSAEAGPRAKADRQGAVHVGAKVPKGRPMVGTKRSGFKRKMDGTVERRD